MVNLKSMAVLKRHRSPLETVLDGLKCSGVLRREFDPALKALRVALVGAKRQAERAKQLQAFLTRYDSMTREQKAKLPRCTFPCSRTRV